VSLGDSRLKESMAAVSLTFDKGFHAALFRALASSFFIGKHARLRYALIIFSSIRLYRFYDVPLPKPDKFLFC